MDAPSEGCTETVKKTGSSEPTHHKPEGELVIILSVCVASVRARLAGLWFLFHFCQGSSVQLTAIISTIKGFSQGCSNSIEWPTSLCAFTL